MQMSHILNDFVQLSKQEVIPIIPIPQNLYGALYKQNSAKGA